jgi:hypothetical protein
MKKPSDVFNSIRFAKLDPKHDKGHKGGSTDDEEHGAVSSQEFAQQIAHVKKRSMQEEKKDKFDIGEYDQEGDMAKSDLRSIIANAKKMHDMIEDDDNLPEWVQSKITKAEDYISTVANYMASEMSEETKLQESGGDVVFKKGDNHIEKYGEDSFALYKDGKKAKYYTSLDAAKEAMNEEVVQEGRPSQRHPLEGHEYHKKTNAELEYIAKDAHKAAEAMKSHNTTAENKYRDQANDSATVRYFRQKNGMPDWYKKKYGHVKEDIQMEAQDKPPFDPPYKTNKGVVTDKSGAKHGPMSMARNLARQAMKKQAEKMSVKESLEESRKTDIVKEAFKKAKKKNDETFQSEPELGSSVVKADN